jgi:hypothetical protein
MCLFCSLAFAQDDKQAVCKGSEIPPDRVVVSEFQSAGCSDPDTNNAWDTVVPKDGTITCAKRPITSTASVFEFELCEEVISSSCPSKMDGTANAFVLRTPASCLAKKGTGLHAECGSQMTRNYPLFDAEAGDTFRVVGGTNMADCKAPDHGYFYNARIMRLQVPTSVIEFCAPPVDSRVRYSGEVRWNEVILRRFHTKACELDEESANIKTLNTVAVQQLEKRPPPDMPLCFGTQMTGNISLGKTFFSPMTGRSDPALHYGEEDIKEIYTPLCGIDERKEPNATEILAPTAHNVNGNPWQGPVECTNGSFYEINPNLNWNLIFSGSSLNGERSPGGCSLSLLRQGGTWNGALLCNGEPDQNLIMRPNDSCTQFTSNISTFRLTRR